MEENQFYVYIITNQGRTVLYTGVTNDLQRRVVDHRIGKGGIFTNRYKLYKLVYFEAYDDVNMSIYREKQIKALSRLKKIDLIKSINPNWDDLYRKYFDK
jgi:putative endonuclease